MSVTVILGENALEPQTWTRHDVDNVVDFLYNKYDSFPDTARIYENQVSVDNDVTPTCDTDIEELLNKTDTVFYVIVYPGDPITIIVAVVAVVAVAAAAFLLVPKIPNAAVRNTQTESPNNELSDRQNRPRVNGRIPDIYGTVNATPDLLAVPYKVFEANEEVELAFMCLGRGEYEVVADDIKDDTTRISDISGATVEIFGPGTSPNSGHDPQLRVGTAISEPVYSSARTTAVNGQVLRAPNSDSFAGNANVRFVSPDEVHLNSSSDADFRDYFAAGDTLVISNASFTGTVSGSGVNVNYSAKFTSGGQVVFETDNTNLFSVGDTLTISGAFFTYNSGANAIDLSGTYVIQGKTTDTLTLQSPATVNSAWNLIENNFTNDETTYKTCGFVVPSGQTTINLSGTYTILSVVQRVITLSNPSLVNTDWNTLSSFANSRTDYISPTLVTTADKWVGPFTIDNAETDRIFCNFVAINGLYKDDGTTQFATNVQVELEITPIDADDNPTGAAQTFTATVIGSEQSRSTRGVTLRANPSFSGRMSIRARRVTNADLSFEGQVVDEIKWRDAYVIQEVGNINFGDVTTVHAVTYATSGALSVKDRKVNMKVTRKIPTRVSGSTFSTTKSATNSADEILAAICLDPFIGGRDVTELDLDSIYDTVAAIKTYFGYDNAASFNYTFDRDNISFEETVASVASAIFSTAYRQGNVIKLSFEQETDDSILLFNHRNKLPGSETRTIRFGNQNDNDGVEYNYVDDEDGAIVTLYLPSDKSATSPKRVESVGVRGGLQAYFHANRIWNKIRYQHVATEFDATQEAELLIVGDRILVADNTRPGTQDGDVRDQDGLTLTLSQDPTFETGKTYTIFLQHVDGTVESMSVTNHVDTYKVVLSRAPKSTLSTDPENFAQATYQIVADDSTREQSFIMTEKEPLNNFTFTVRGVNYDSKYYDQDDDYKTGVVNDKGVVV